MLIIQSKAAQSYSDYSTALEVTAVKLMQQLKEQSIPSRHANVYWTFTERLFWTFKQRW